MSNRNRRSRRSKWDDPVSPLQAARFEHRWNQMDVCLRVREVCPGHGEGKPCRMEPSKLSEYERGQRDPSMKHVLALGIVFSKSPAELGLLRRPGMANGAENSSATNQTSTGYATPKETTQSPEGDKPRGPLDDDVLLAVLLRVLLGDREGKQMRRDDFIRGVGAAAGAAFVDPFVVLSQQAQAEIHHTKISSDQIKRLTGAAYAHARSGYQLDQTTRLRNLVIDWATAQQLFGQPQTLRQRLELTNAYARLSGILSLTAFDLGNFERARVLRETAQDAARESGDLELLAWLYERACDAVDDTGIPRDLVEASGRGLAVLGNSQSLTAARLHAWAARGYGSLGDAKAAATHLEAAARIFDKNLPGCWPNDVGLPRGYTFGEDGLAVATGNTFLRLGAYRRAIVQCERAESLHVQFGLRLVNASVVAHNRLYRATALLHTGEVEGATQLATSTVAGYGGKAQTLVNLTARRFERALTSVDTSGTYARQFSEFLRSRAA